MRKFLKSKQASHKNAIKCSSFDTSIHKLKITDTKIRFLTINMQITRHMCMHTFANIFMFFTSLS